MKSTLVVFGVCYIILQNGVSSRDKIYEIETGEDLSPPIYFGYFKGDKLTMLIYLKNKAPNVLAALSVSTHLGNLATTKDHYNAVNQSYLIVERQLTQDTISIDLELIKNKSCSCSKRISEGRLITGTTNSTYAYTGICSTEFCKIVVDVKKHCNKADGGSCMNGVSACYPSMVLLLLLIILIKM